MKDSPNSHPPSLSPTLSIPLLLRSVAAILIFSLGFSLGSLSSSKPSPPLLPTPTPTPTPPDLLKFRTQCAKPLTANQVPNSILKHLYNGTSPYTNFPSPPTTPFLLPPNPHPHGWGSTSPVFHHLISTHRPSIILELGTFLGASALHMASVSSNLSLSTLILCVDDFRGWPALRTHPRLRRRIPPHLHADALLLQQFMLNVVAAGQQDRVLPLPYSTASALSVMCEWGVYADLVEVDAGHDFHSAWADINRAWAVLRPGGVMFGHDYHTKFDDMGVRRAVQLFARLKGLHVTGHGEHWVLQPKPELVA